MGSMIHFSVQTAERLGLNYEINIIDDGSDEHTLELLEEITTRFDNVQVVRHEENKGYGGALRSGFQAGDREWIFYTDGDAQYDVREMELLISEISDDVDVVQGYKITRHDPLHRIVIGRIYHTLVKIAFGLKLRDVDCDFRLLRRSIFDTIELKSNSGVICAEMMTKIQRAGFTVKEVPVHHFQRAHGKSQFFNFPRVARVVWQLQKLWWANILYYRLGRGEKP